jgi:hypothetical protein
MEAASKEIGTVVRELQRDLSDKDIIKHTSKIFKDAYLRKEITKKDMKSLKNLVKGLLK